jgi:hypothetical protein
MKGSATVLRVALWLGIVVDWALGLPTTFAPEGTLQLIGQGPVAPTDRVWVAFGFMLSVLLSMFFVPGAIDPYAYRVSVWLAVGARVPEALFFFVLYPGPHSLFGILYALLFILQAPLLWLVMRGGPSVERAGGDRMASEVSSS